MLVVNLSSWAGLDFSHAPGDLVDLPDDVAADRIAAGLAEAAPESDPVAAESDQPRRRVRRSA